MLIFNSSKYIFIFWCWNVLAIVGVIQHICSVEGSMRSVYSLTCQTLFLLDCCTLWLLERQIIKSFIFGNVLCERKRHLACFVIQLAYLIANNSNDRSECIPHISDLIDIL